jgi:hypothetical protein
MSSYRTIRTIRSKHPYHAVGTAGYHRYQFHLSYRWIGTGTGAYGYGAGGGESEIGTGGGRGEP